MFTENLREAFRSVGFLRRWFLKLYNFSRIPVRPVYGGFPVKFRTYLGDPIPYDPAVTPEQLQQKVNKRKGRQVNLRTNFNIVGCESLIPIGGCCH